MSIPHDINSQSTARRSPEIKRRAPPYMCWDPKGRLQISVERPDQSRIRHTLRTDELAIAEQRIRVVIAAEIADGRLPPDGRVAQMYGPNAVTNVCAGHISNAKFWAEIARLEALPPATYKAEREVGRQRLGISPSWLDHLVRRGLGRADRIAPPYMCWKSDSGQPVLACLLDSGDGFKVKRRLNTPDTEVAAERMRLIVWHAISKGLPRGLEHEAWRLYGGPIPHGTKRLLKRLAALPWAEYKLQRLAVVERLGYDASTIDWLTDQQKARPVTVAAAAQARHRGRIFGKSTPILRWWPFRKTGGMVKVSRGLVYGRLTVDDRIFRWRLEAKNRAEGDAVVKPIVEARARVKKAAFDFRECVDGSTEAEAAWAALFEARRLFVQTLRDAGAELALADDWAKLASLLLKDPPQYRARNIRPPPTGARRRAVSSFVRDLGNPKFRDRPPIESHREYLRSKIEKIGGGLTFAAAEKAFKEAQNQTANWSWSKQGRRRPSRETT
jgi:hypothetical protein